MTVLGIDIASYQSATFNTSGLSFVFVKATEGTGYVNPRHAAQVAHGREHGLTVGHYHFARPGPPAPQADFFLRTTARRPGDILALDWEDPGVSNADKDAWIRHVQATAPGHRVLLYCNRDFWLNRDSTSVCGDGLWIADPEAAIGHPRVQHPWTLHQYGIRGTDLDTANFPNAATLRAWANKTTPPSPPPSPRPPAALVPARKVAVHVVEWAATHSEAAERRYPQNEPQILAVQNALVANQRLKKGHFLPGIFDTRTRTAYAAEQHAQGYRGADADGVPGRTSLTRLGRQHGTFTVTA